MKKQMTDKEEAETVLVFVPRLGSSILVADQADVERQVKQALDAQEVGDGNN